MATIAMILRDDRWQPFLVSDIKVGDVYRLIVNGVPQDLRRSLGTPLQVVDAAGIAHWEFACEPVPDEMK